MKSLQECIADAVAELGAIPFFPRDEDGRLAIMRGIEAFVSTPAELRWLVDTAVAEMPEWGSVATLRVIHARRPRLERNPDPTCPECYGTGQRIVQKRYRGEVLDAAEKCSCWAVGNPAPLESGGGEGPREHPALPALMKLQPIAALVPVTISKKAERA